MSRLLINEAPLQVLPTLATAIGLNGAIFLQQLHYLLVSAPETAMSEGRRWYPCILKEWRPIFPFWSASTIERTITALRDQNLIETTADFNDEPDNRSLWYAVNYQAVDDLEFAPAVAQAPVRIVQKREKQPFRQNDVRVLENTDEQPFRQNDVRVPAPEESSEKPFVNLTKCSSYREVKTPTTPETENPHLNVVLGGGVGGEFQNWTEHLNLQKGPALNLTLALWAGWVEEGLASALKEASTAVILMGGKAVDPSALLKARMGRQRDQRTVEVARAAVAAADAELLNQGAEQIAGGDRFRAPTGRTLTVDFIEDGNVFWVEPDPEAPIGTVLRWSRAAAGGVA